MKTLNRFLRYTFAFTLAISLFTIPSVTAEETEDDLLGGFEETDSTNDDAFDGFEDGVSEQTETREVVETEESIFSFGGHILVSSSFNYSHDEPETGQTDFRGLSRLRSTLQLELETKLPLGWKGFVSGSGFYDSAYGINGTDNYTQGVLDTHEQEGELRDAYIQGSIKNLDLKIGRQIVVWGKSDNIRVTDILNPTDNREPGMVDIEDLRLPVTMARANYYFGNWNLEMISMQEKRSHKFPGYGSDFYPAPFEMPDSEFGDEQEYAVALKGLFSGYDISFFSAKVYDKSPHVESIYPTIEVSHSYLTMTGFAANIAYGNMLFKTEAAYFDGLEYFYGGGETKSRTDTLIGIEYTGLLDQVVSIEAANRHINDFLPAMENLPDNAQEDENIMAFRYSADLLHSRLHLMCLALTYGSGGEGGGIQRISAGYDLVDALLVTAGLINYDSGDQAFFQNIGENDRLFLEAKYSF